MGRGRTFIATVNYKENMLHLQYKKGRIIRKASKIRYEQDSLGDNEKAAECEVICTILLLH